MKDFDLFTLRLFVAVCDAGNMLSVSEREHIDPSAITKRFAKLEQELGVTLLKRTGKGVTPTVEGNALLDSARGLLEQAGRIAKHMRDFKAGASDTVEIMANTSICAGFLPYDIANFLNHPNNKNINIVMHYGDRASTVQSVLDGRVSLGIIWNSTNTKGLKTIAYRPEHIAAYFHRSHPLSKKKNITYNDAKKFERVAILSNRNVELEFANKKVIEVDSLKFRAIAPTYEIALRLAEMQVGILLAPYEMKLFVQSSNLMAIPLNSESAKRDYAICYQDENTLSSAAKRLLIYLENAAKSQHV
jgi:DNA-binding transcriptional LysR family regulator